PRPKKPPGRSGRSSACAWHPPTFRALPNPHAALLAHELLDIVGTAGSASCRSACFPPAKGIDTRPGAGGGAGAPVSIRDARFNPIEKLRDLTFVLGKNSGRQPVFRSVGQVDRLFERRDVCDHGD